MFGRFAFLLAPALLLSSGALAQSEGVVRACGNPNYPPWVWEQAGQVHGTCVEVARQAFASAGLALKVEAVGSWSRCQLMVEHGDVDVNLCGFDSARRREYAVMVQPPMGHNEAVVFTRRGSPLRFDSWESLRGQRVGMARGTTAGTEFDDFLRRNAQVDAAVGEPQNLRKLILGRVDAVVTGRELGLLTLKTLGCGDEVVVLSRPVMVGPIYMQVSKRSPHLGALPKVTAFLRQPGYSALLSSLHASQGELFAAQHPLPAAERCSGR